MRIGIIRYWAGRPAAEHEVIARMQRAAAARGHELVELNPDGSALDAAATMPSVDLVLNLHYSSPKALDVPHVGALWNPLDFYHKFGFVPHWANQMSHDYLASCGSAVVEAAVEPFRPELFAGEGLPLLNHTVPERYLPARPRQDRRLFYVGVNWEKLGDQPGRHDDLLYLLDRTDLTRIYGPRLIDGVAPWAGYSTYRGDLPFDGWSVVQAIAEAGTALVTSSPAHYQDAVMSSRPFEAAAAGVPIISERHPFMLEHFSDAAVFYDERAPVREQAEQITELVRTLNADPDRAVALGERAQAVVREHFNLDQQLDSLCSWVAARSATRDQGAVPATAVVVPTGTAAELAAWVTHNLPVLSRFAAVLVAAPFGGSTWTQAAAPLGQAARVATCTRADAGWSERAATAADAVDGPVCFLHGDETLFADYPDAVVRAVSEGSAAGLVPAVSVPNQVGVDVNARLPALICGSVSTWWELASACVPTTGDRVRELRRRFGPGLHIGVLAAHALEADRGLPRYIPALRLAQSADGDKPWSIGELAGLERHADAAYAQALPTARSHGLPESLLARDPSVHDAPRPLRSRAADAIRRSALPDPVVRALITAGKATLRPSRRARS